MRGETDSESKTHAARRCCGFHLCYPLHYLALPLTPLHTRRSQSSCPRCISFLYLWTLVLSTHRWSSRQNLWNFSNAHFNRDLTPLSPPSPPEHPCLCWMVVVVCLFLFLSHCVPSLPSLLWTSKNTWSCAQQSRSRSMDSFSSWCFYYNRDCCHKYSFSYGMCIYQQWHCKDSKNWSTVGRRM